VQSQYLIAAAENTFNRSYTQSTNRKKNTSTLCSEKKIHYCFLA